MRIIGFILFLSLIGCGKKFDDIIDAEPIYKTTQTPTEFLDHTKEYFQIKNITTDNKMSDGQVYNEAFNIIRYTITQYDFDSEKTK